MRQAVRPGSSTDERYAVIQRTDEQQSGRKDIHCIQKKTDRESFCNNEINTSDRSPLRGLFVLLGSLFILFVCCCFFFLSGPINES